MHHPARRKTPPTAELLRHAERNKVLVLLEFAEKTNAKEIVKAEKRKLQKVAEMAVARSRGIRVAKCDLNNCILPYGDGYFDLVLMEKVIEHLVNPDNALKETHRVLRHGGLFVVSTPNLAWWVNRIALMLGYQPYWTEVSTMFNVGKFRGRINEPLSGHLRLYTFRSLRDLLKLHGFIVIKALGVTYKANKPFMVYMLDRLLNLRTTLAEVIAILATRP